MSVHPHYGEAFARHAGLDEIDHEIRCSEVTLRRAEETIEWLRELKAARTEQLAARRGSVE